MPRSGSVLAAAIVAIGVVFGLGMWHAQQRSYYEPVTGLTDVTIGGRVFAVTDYSGTDGDRTPLKLRGCFRLEDPAAAVAAGEATDDAVPLTTPDWIECFDEGAIYADLEAGLATPILAGEDDGDGADLFMAIYPDGRGYSWRQPNDTYERR